ncbi:MAG: hypothetical protein KF857_06060 [Fimbriimonadaceae bacterium]|nr:hypothetical protein [Fimbriimonadaceae bacterium]
MTWQETVAEAGKSFGHRNWIVVGDAAMPVSSSPGYDVVLAEASLPDVLSFVLKSLGSQVKPVAWLDAELELVEEAAAKGVEECRRAIAAGLKGVETRTAPHEEILARLDQTSRAFKVLMVKSTLQVPYTSVFLELDCGYWCADREAALRRRMAGRIGHNQIV